MCSHSGQNITEYVLVHNQHWEEQNTLATPQQQCPLAYSSSYRDSAVGEKWKHSYIKFWGKQLKEKNKEQIITSRFLIFTALSCSSAIAIFLL